MCSAIEQHWLDTTHIAHLCRANVGPADNPSEGVVGSPVVGGWPIVAPTVVTVEVGPTLAHRWQNFAVTRRSPDGGLMSSG